jgi:hypothetical protein
MLCFDVLLPTNHIKVFQKHDLVYERPKQGTYIEFHGFRLLLASRLF